MTSVAGRITGLQRSAGGVPKLSVERVRVNVSGMEGDRQANRKYHGGLDRALCLYAQDRLDALVAEGHPVGRGALGENVTIAGLPWESVQPGARLHLGAVEVEVTAYAPPCKTIGQAFKGRAFTRVSQVVNPGWSRVYVRILVPGELAVGNAVTLAP